MKIKSIFIYGALAVAFAAVCVWVFLSGGKNARAVRAKFRIGGLMLSISSMFLTAGCRHIIQPTCYDTAAPEFVKIAQSNTTGDLKVGDVVLITVEYGQFTSYSYEINKGDSSEVLQSGDLVITDGSGTLTISPTDYKGPVTIVIYGSDGGGNTMAGYRYFTLK